MMTSEQIATYVDATAAALSLPLDPAHRPGVLSYFALAASLAEVVDGLPLQPSDEGANIFIPVPARDEEVPR